MVFDGTIDVDFDGTNDVAFIAALDVTFDDALDITFNAALAAFRAPNVTKGQFYTGLMGQTNSAVKSVPPRPCGPVTNKLITTFCCMCSQGMKTKALLEERS